ncbi:DUF402 domain-containing protein [Streptomyces antimycoticus]|uniref:DUF402 domain-containing protein n=1 Tax=Streptomyces antimycoticus TaxID=68175 RepID=UPI00343806C6
MGYFEAGETAVRRGVYRGRVWSEQALRVLEDTGAALVAARRPGAEARWPSLYTKARADGDRSARTEAFGAMATEEWELRAGAWQDTELVLWKPPAAWFSINAFYTSAGLRNWYVNFEYPTRRTDDGFDTFDLTVDLLIAPDLSSWQWKDEDEYAHVRRLGIVSESERRPRPRPSPGHAPGTRRLFADADRWASWHWQSPSRRPGCPSAPQNADTRLPRPHELPLVS